jgi:hypothetical protein
VKRRGLSGRLIAPAATIAGFVACSPQPTQTVGAGQGGYQFSAEYTLLAASDGGPPGLDVTFAPTCFPSAPVERPDGGADCLVLATLPGDAPCSTYPGMSDPPGPAGAPTSMLVDASSGTSRVCAMEQVAGADAQACETDQSCAGCGPGWCVANSNAACPNGFLRFVGGVLPQGSPSVQLACDLDTE